MPVHDTLCLLQNVLTAPRLMYLLRSTLCIDSPVLPVDDALLRESFVCNAQSRSATAASTTELTYILLPARLRAVNNSGIDAAVAAWTRLAANLIEMSTASAIPSLIALTAQRVWNEHWCKIQLNQLLHATSDPVNRECPPALCSLGSGDWLHELPLSSVGLKLDNATVQIDVLLRLRAPVVCSHNCVCGRTYGYC